MPGHRRGRRLPDQPLLPRNPHRPGLALRLHRDRLDDRLGDRPHLRRRHRRPQPAPDRLFAGFAWTGAIAASAMFFIAGTNWQLGIVLILIASMCLGASLVIYDSILIRIANENERDRVSSKGWAMGYLGGGILPPSTSACSASTSGSASPRARVRISLLSAGVWWGAFTLIPYLGCAPSPAPSRPRWTARPASSAAVSPSSARPSASCATTRRRCCSCSPTSSSTTASRPSSATPASTGRKGSASTRAPCSACSSSCSSSRSSGALLRRRGGPDRGLADGALRPRPVDRGRRHRVLRPRQAADGLSRPRAAHRHRPRRHAGPVREPLQPAHPRGREAEFFSLYQAMERGTSWLGTLIFGLVYQFSHSYRYAIVALVVFFVVGGLLLAKVDMRRGIERRATPSPWSCDTTNKPAGNPRPEQRNRLARSSVCEGVYPLGTGHRLLGRSPDGRSSTTRFQPRRTQLRE